MPSLDYAYLAKLALRAKMGDSDAFAEIYAATYQRQYSFAHHYMRDEYLAQDALQETYVLALQNISRLNDPTLLVAWLNQICFRVCFNMQKKQQRYNQEMSDFADWSVSDSETLASPETHVVRIDSQEYIMNQVLNLPFTESQVIIMKYYHNTPHDEIAQMMDISRASVNRYLKSGKERLKKLLQL